MSERAADATDAARLALEWGDRVRANRAQVAVVRRGPERSDFYAPVSAHFVEDPRRTDDRVLDALLGLARPEETWLDIGAGAGRYALPLALAVREVIAVDPSRAMLDALRAGMDEHGITNVRVLEGRWPEVASDLAADVALIAQVGYDIEGIAAFLDAMERAARRRCVAVMMDRSPATAADVFWPPVHGMARVPLPALPELLALLRARGARPRVRTIPRPLRVFGAEAEMQAYLRQQLWTEPGDPADDRLQREIDRRRSSGWDGLGLEAAPALTAVVTWESRRRTAHV